MYSENRLRDLKLFARACATNLLARTAPAAYVRLTGQTGRGADEDNEDDIAAYFEQCVADYQSQLGLDAAGFARFLQGKRVLEYGPGDVLGVALWLYAHGAEHVHCVDRFPLQSLSDRNARVYERLLARLPHAARSRAQAAFVEPGDVRSGLRPQAVEYRVTPDGLAARAGSYELVLSRAVLEHVNSLERTLQDVEHCLAPGGVSLHSVDLRSHNLDRDRPFDFLTWPHWAYRWMYSHKGFPNRWRAANYRQTLGQTRLVLRTMAPTAKIAAADLQRIRPHLAPGLDGGDADELCWQGFWMLLEKPA